MPSKKKAPPAKKAPFVPRGTEVRVTWIDACFDLDKEPPLMQLHTYGRVMKHNAEVVVVASEGDDADYHRSFTTIPAGWVRKITRMLPAAD